VWRCARGRRGPASEPGHGHPRRGADGGASHPFGDLDGSLGRCRRHEARQGRSVGLGCDMQPSLVVWVGPEVELSLALLTHRRHTHRVLAQCGRTGREVVIQEDAPPPARLGGCRAGTRAGLSLLPVRQTGNVPRPDPGSDRRSVQPCRRTCRGWSRGSRCAPGRGWILSAGCSGGQLARARCAHRSHHGIRLAFVQQASAALAPGRPTTRGWAICTRGGDRHEDPAGPPEEADHSCSAAVEDGGRVAASAARARWSAMPPKTTVWKGAIVHQ
jgi:hypothetical protein